MEKDQSMRTLLVILRKPGMITRNLWIVCLIIAVVVGLAVAFSQGLFADPDVASEFEGQFAYVYPEPENGNMLLVIDGDIFHLPIKEGEPEGRRLDDADLRPQDLALTPYIHYKNGQRTIYRFKKATYRGNHTGELEVRRLWGEVGESELEGDQFYWEERAAEVVQEALSRGCAMIPVLFPEQKFTFQHEKDWYHLRVKAEEQAAGGYRYRFFVEMAEKSSAESQVTSSDYRRTNLSNDVAAWLPQDWKQEEKDVLDYTVEKGTEQLAELFEIAHFISVELAVVESSHLLPQFDKHRRVMIPAATIIADHSPDSDYVNLQRGLAESAYFQALFELALTPDSTPEWLDVGLRELLSAGFIEDGHHPAKRAAALVQGLHKLNNRQSPEHILKKYPEIGAMLVYYLKDEFGLDKVLEYALASRPPTLDHWAVNEELAEEIFGLGQREIYLNAFSAVIFRTDAIPTRKAISPQ